MGKRQRRRDRGRDPQEQDTTPAVTVQAGLAQAVSSVAPPAPEPDNDSED